MKIDVRINSLTPGEGSVLNAVCCYPDRYNSADEFIAEYASSSDKGISSIIQSAVYRLILD